MKKYKIFKVYHDRELLKTFPCPEDRTYYDTSLDEWGKYFCEGLIFFDDNLDIDAEYIGLEHYCRSFTNLNVNTADEYLSKVDNNFCWTWFHNDSYTKDIGYFSSKIFNWSELDHILFKYLKEKKLFKELMMATRSDLLIHRTMFILTKDNFIKMRQFIRDATKYFLSELKIEKPSDIDILVKDWKPELSVFRGTSRLFAFIIEHLAAVWIAANIKNLKDFPDILENGNKEFRYDFTNLDIHLVDLCNLNCAYCSHLAPFAGKFFLNPEKFEKDLASIPMFVRNKFKYIQLLGGEPLLHPLVCDIIKIARKYFPNKDIRLLTNGILLPKMNQSFYDCIRENNVFLNITLYPTKFDYSFIDKLKDINILTHKVNDSWDGGFWRQQLDPKGLLDYNYLYKFCLDHRKLNCLQLDGTFLRCCPTEKHAHFLNNFLDINIRNFKEDWLDLSKVKDIQEIDDWYYTPKKFCSQCVNDKWEPKNIRFPKENLKNMYDYLIVGAGLYGSVFAWRAKLDGKRCLIIDKRNHLGGNLYCEEINGILVHKYGPHIFHTSDKKIWDFINLFTEFKPFTLQTIANYNGRLYNLPFNMNTFYLLWKTRTPEEAKKIIESLKYKGVITNLEEQALALVGKDVYTTLIKGYTEKLWGCKCSLLPPNIIKRIPLRFNFDNNYFNDIYCGVGNYNKLISGLLLDIDYLLETDFFTLKGIEFNKLVYTGPIDRYFDYMFGPLRWRSLRWETEILETENYQGVPIMNFTGEEPYTRIVEYKHFLSKSSPNTVIVKEFPMNTGDLYYPIDIDNPYSLITEPNVIFGGRLAEYKYYNMDQIIEKALYDYNTRG